MNPSKPSSRFTSGLTSLALLTSLTSCGPTPAPGPPTLHLARDTCAECGMIINEARFAAALTLDPNATPNATPNTSANSTANISSDHLVFDDIGDMLAYERAHPDLPILARYVHDYDSKPTADWLDAQSATFLISDTIKTPMASGIIAFADPTRAQAAATAANTHPLSLSELLSRPAH